MIARFPLPIADRLIFPGQSRPLARDLHSGIFVPGRDPSPLGRGVT